MSKSNMRTGTKPAPKSATTKPSPRTPATPSTPTRPATAPAPQRVPAAPEPRSAPERRSNATPVQHAGPIAGAVAPTNSNSADNANADITSESNFNQGKTSGEHRSEQQAATEEAAQQLRDHPGGLPLPTSGQPLTKPEPDAAAETK